jgi:hypothetical protein
VGVALVTAVGVLMAEGVGVGIGTVNWARTFRMTCWAAALTSDGLGLHGLILLSPEAQLMVPVANTVAPLAA